MKRFSRVKNIGAFSVACLAALSFFLFVYRYDNKYAARAPVTPDGAILSRTDLEEDRLVFLASGWELYPDQLLTPQQIAIETTSPEQTFIGQYLSLSAFHEDRSPYGAATYRIRLNVAEPGKTVSAVLLLQEVFCACTIYVNGEPVASSGQISPYRPQVRDLAVPIPLGEPAEIVIQTVNQTHYYSGITYPPALGTPEAIHLLSFYRMLFYGFLCFSSLTLALFSIAVWSGYSRIRKEGPVSFWFGLLAVSFAVRISYPFLRTVGFSAVRSLYALEDAAFLFGVWCAVKILLCTSGQENASWGTALSRMAFHIFLVGTVFPPVLLPLLPAFVPVYGQIIYWYKLLSALLLIALAFWSGYRRPKHSGWRLAGLGVYGTSLFCHAVWLNRFEPARFGWLDEYGAFVLVLCFAGGMVGESYELLRGYRRLNENLQDEVREKTRKLNSVLEERRQFLAGAAHDLKAPMTSLQLYAQVVEEGGIGLDEETRNNIRMIRRKSAEMQERLQEIQSFAYQDAQPLRLEVLDFSKLVRDFYTANLPDMEVAGVECRLELPISPCVILGDKTRLERVLQNVAYNALSFTPMDGRIEIALSLEEGSAVLKISDTGCGISPEELPHIFEQFYSRREDDSGSGLGLYIARSIVHEHDGEITANSELGKGTVFFIRLPLHQDSVSS